MHATRARTHASGDRHVTRTALIVVDAISPFDFAGASRMMPAAHAVADRLVRLQARCRAAGVPVIYANDNHGRWRSSFEKLLQLCQREGARGAAIAHLLQPEPTDYFVLKPQQSAFFRTPLEDLLHRLHVRRLIVTGFVSDGCVLATAVGAAMRQYEVVVPSDTAAALTPARHERALALLRDAMSAKTTPSRYLRLV